MYNWLVLFLIVGLAASLLGFRGVAGGALLAAKYLIYVMLVALIVVLVFNLLVSGS